MTQEARSRHDTEARSTRRSEIRGQAQLDASWERHAHPVLALQRTLGNRAVQRLVTGERLSRPSVVRRAVLQRVLSPATAAMGRSATNDLLSSWAGVYLGASDTARQANTLNTTVFDLLQPITMVQATLAVAENEPAPTGGGGGSEVTPVTPTEVPVPAQNIEERP